MTNRSVLEVHGFREEVDADGGLVGVVEAIVHEAGDERRLADCNQKQNEVNQQREKIYSHMRVPYLNMYMYSVSTVQVARYCTTAIRVSVNKKVETSNHEHCIHVTCNM